MTDIRRNVNKILLITAISLAVGLPPLPGHAHTAQDLRHDAAQSLHRLCQTQPEAEEMARSAKAVLVFPKVTKAGLAYGGSYGEGVMTRNRRAVGYYNSVSASWVLQAEAESFGYAVFLMNDSALRHLENTLGWELSLGPAVVVVTDAVAKRLSTSAPTDDAYAYVFDAQGRRVSSDIGGTKVSAIRRV